VNMAGGSGATVPAPAERGMRAPAGPALPPFAATAVPASRWPDLRKRAASAAVLLPAAVFCIGFGGWPWAGLLMLAVALLAWEWVRLCGFGAGRWPGIVVPVATLAALALGLAGAWWLALGLLALGGALLAVRATPGAARWLAFGVPYTGLAGLALLALRGDPTMGPGNVLFLFLVVWASDIGAYLAGRWLGGPKLAPAISPNKTWAGAAGGLVAAMAVGLAAALALGGDAGIGLAPLVAAWLGLVSQAGDLFESWIKRRFNVKDSSGLIPGHGGLLDRLDGVLTAAPAAALLGIALGPGTRLWH